MADYVTDTHSLVWYLEGDSRLSDAAGDAFEACDRGDAAILAPTICLVEITYLVEKGRISPHLRESLSAALRAGTSGVRVAPLTLEIADALARIPKSDVPDMPDRIIAATALHLGAALITKDHRIRLSGITTIW